MCCISKEKFEDQHAQDKIYSLKLGIIVIIQVNTEVL